MVVSDVEAVLTNEPDVLLLDYEAPRVACGLLRVLRFRHIVSPAALIVSRVDEDCFRTATDLGVNGLLQRERSLVLIADCLTRVAAGKTCIDGAALFAPL